MELAPRLIDVKLGEHALGAVLVLHGGAARRGNPMVSPTQLSGALARAIGARYVCVRGGKHAMLRHHGRFDGLAADFAVETLL